MTEFLLIFKFLYSLAKYGPVTYAVCTPGTMKYKIKPFTSEEVVMSASSKASSEKKSAVGIGF